MELGVFTIFTVVFLSIFELNDALQGPNVCTQVISVRKIDRIPTGGIMTQKIRYTTKCGLIGKCSKYRIVYVPGFRENTRMAYRVVQVCCSGFQVAGKRCIKAPPPTTPKDPKVEVTTDRATTAGKTPGNPGNVPLDGVPGPGPGTGILIDGNPVFDRGFKPGTGAGGPGGGQQGVGNNGVGGGTARNGNSQGSYPNSPGSRTGSGPWVGLGPGPGPGRQPGTETGTQRTNVAGNYPRYQGPISPVNRDKNGGSHVDVVYPGIANGPAVDPDYRPRNYDPVMAFVSSATAAIGLLTLASTILGIFLLHRRQQGQEGAGAKPFSSFKLRSLGSGKSIETKVEMQTITSNKSEPVKEAGKNGRFRADCPYVDIEQMRNASAAGAEAQDATATLIPTGNTSENNSKGKPFSSRRSRKNSGKNRGSLPPEPPTYAVVRKPKKSHGSEDGKQTRMTVASISGRESASLSASLEGPFTERGSAHIYAQINRKSKGVSSSWSRSSSLPSRPTTLVSNSDLQTSSSYRAIESFTRSLGRATQKLDVRRSGCESSGYSSLQESKETLLYDTCSRRSDRMAAGGVAPAALYRTLKEKGLCGRTEYDKLSRGVKDTKECDESVLRGYATLSMDSV